jgi:hypothetical protein
MPVKKLDEGPKYPLLGAGIVLVMLAAGYVIARYSSDPITVGVLTLVPLLVVLAVTGYLASNRGRAAAFVVIALLQPFLLPAAIGLGVYERTASALNSVFDEASAVSSDTQPTEHPSKAPKALPKVDESADDSSAAGFKPFTRDWGAHSAALTVTPKGYVKETVGEGCCKELIHLEYQLSNPEQIEGGWTADAVVKKVDVTDFPSPTPTIGEQGEVFVEENHFHDPFVYPDNAYCDEADMKHWDCGA